MRYLMQTTPQRRQGRGSSGPESLFEVNRRSRKSKSRRSSKAKRRVKSPPDSGTVDSDWYVFCFNLAHFTLHSSWHVLGCVNFVLAPDMFVICIPHVYYTGVCYGDTERAFEALLERLSSFFVVLLTCRFALCLFITESKSRVKHETNPQVLFSSFVFSCADKFTGRLFWGVFKHRNDEIPKCENQVKSRSSKIMSLSEAVRGKHGVPHMGSHLDLRRWSAVTWRKNSVGFPSQPNPLRGRQKDIAHPLLKSPRGL